MRKIILTALLCGALTTVAHAQPNIKDAPKGQNPPNTGRRGPQTPEEKAQAQQQIEDIMRKAQEEGTRIMHLSPAEQKKELQKIQEQMLRQQFENAGFKDKALQDAVLEFIAAQEKARGPVRRAANKVYLALEPNGDPTTPAGMNLLLTNYFAAVDDAKAQREAATKDLDAKIHFSKNPHLTALLTLSGLISEASWYTSGVQMLGSMAIGSLAGIDDAPPAK